MMTSIPNRGVVAVSGPDRSDFLQGLVTNDMRLLETNPAIYACLLSPQGKFKHDFFIFNDAGNERFLLDIERARIGDFMSILSMYKLRARVDVADLSNAMTVTVSDIQPEGQMLFFRDTRSEKMGWRGFMPIETAPAFDSVAYADFERRRILAGIPDGSRDIGIDLDTLAESNIDVLGGVSFDKGCYMGQELTARMKYRGLLKKRLSAVRFIDGLEAAAAGTDIADETGRRIGVMHSGAGDVALAKLPVLSEDETRNLLKVGDRQIIVI